MVERSGILSAVCTWLWSSSAHVGASTPNERDIQRAFTVPSGRRSYHPITLYASVHSGSLSSSTGHSNLRSPWHSEAFREEVDTKNIVYKCRMAHLCNPMAPALLRHIHWHRERTLIEIWPVFGNRGALAPHPASCTDTQEIAVGVYRW